MFGLTKIGADSLQFLVDGVVNVGMDIGIEVIDMRRDLGHGGGNGVCDK